MSTPSRPARRRRWPLGLAALLGLLLLGSVVTAVVNGRRLEGSVPGEAPILGLAASANGFLIGTSDGLLASTDGRSWEPVAGFEGETLVAGSASAVIVISGGQLSITRDLKTFESVPAELDRSTAVTVTPAGDIWVADGSDAVLKLDPAGGPAARVPLEDGPQEVLSLGIQAGEQSDAPSVLAGGLAAGLWRYEAGSWQRILGTPIRAIQVDPADPRRYLLGTAAGVLVASRTTPEFTGLRLAVEALAEFEGTYYAITADRLLYESKDATTWAVRTSGRGPQPRSQARGVAFPVVTPSR